MGSQIELNDTLEITDAQGFPSDIFNREKHVKNPITLADVEGKVFEFYNKPNPRIFQLDPVRVFFVQNTKDKWLFWGHAMIQSQEITKVLDSQGNWNGNWQTSGTFTISEVYDPDYQVLATINESPEGLSYFNE